MPRFEAVATVGVTGNLTSLIGSKPIEGKTYASAPPFVAPGLRLRDCHPLADGLDAGLTLYGAVSQPLLPLAHQGQRVHSALAPRRRLVKLPEFAEILSLVSSIPSSSRHKA